MRTTTKVLLYAAVLMLGVVIGQRSQSATTATSEIVYASMHQPVVAEPLAKYKPGLDSSVFIEMKQGHCSAAIFEDNYHILTATHCVEKGNSITHTTTHRGARIQNRGRIIANDGNDHVVIRMEKPLVGRPAKIAPLPPPGGLIYIWGNPDDYRFLLRTGYVAGEYLHEDGTFYNVVAIDLWHGDSGGAMFDTAGNIVSVNHAYRIVRNPYSGAAFKVAIIQPFAFRSKLP